MQFHLVLIRSFAESTIFNLNEFKDWYFVTKIVLTYCKKNCSSDQEKLLKFEAEGRELSKILRSQE